jgi:FixJ family two-component response regulator
MLAIRGCLAAAIRPGINLAIAKKTTTHLRPVAVVEDDSRVREAIRDLLSSAELRSQAFRTAESFLRSKSLRRFACLIVDAQLPGMGGNALCEHLSSRGIAIPTIVISADEEGRRRLSTGRSSQRLVAVFAKPFDGREFLRAVRAALRSAR